jgi:hypothetical protein
MTEFIVKRLPGDAEADGLPEDVTIEPSLFPTPQRLVPQYARVEWRAGYQRHLEHRIQRNPRDLYAHVRRVMMYRDLGHNDRGFGALVDLYLILGPRGRPLREKMLDRFEDRLTHKQYRFLCSHLVSGLSASEPLPTGTHSLLAKGISGTTQIVVRSDEPGGEAQPVIAARRRMAEGDETGAQALLEAAVREDPGSMDVCKELLDLYREKGLPDDFFSMYAECLSRDLALPGLWEETQQQFLRSGAPPRLDEG